MSDKLLFLKQSRQAISEHLEAFLLQKKSSYRNDVPWTEDVCERLRVFSQGGKMIRGSLFLLSANMFDMQTNDELLDIAAAIELLHATLLIQDDVMDEDRLRRGKKTIYAQYEEIGIKENISNPTHFGNGMAFMVADISLFMVLELLSTKRVNGNEKTLISYTAKEIQNTGYGQMQDFYLGSTSIEPKEKDIMSVYRYKTARYTFSLPLGMGAVLAGKTQQTITLLEEIGEFAGLIFQIRDDELNYFGVESTVGKTTGSDISRDNKTLHRHYLYENSSTQERNKLGELFGNQHLTSDDIAMVQSLMQQKQVSEKLKLIMDEYYQQAAKRIALLDVSDQMKDVLSGFVTYMREREK